MTSLVLLHSLDSRCLSSQLETRALDNPVADTQLTDPPPDTHDGSWATSSSPSSSVAHGVGGSDVESQYLMREMSEKLPIVKDSADKKFKIDARVISDAIIGLSDGLTVPFALTASLSAIGNTKVVVYGGMAELIAGAISMGLGGYLGAKSEE
jgi:hypothetical protein